MSTSAPTVSTSATSEWPPHIIVGQCSLCGGLVKRLEMYAATMPPKAFCENCGAQEIEPSGLPVIQMFKPK